MSCTTEVDNTGAGITVMGIPGIAYGSSIACYYQSAGETDLAREVDFIWGAASQFGVPAKVALAHRVIENGTAGANPFQVFLPDRETFTQWINEKKPSSAPDLATTMSSSADSINAAAAMYIWRDFYNAVSSSFSSDHEKLLAGINAYHLGPGCVTSHKNYYSEGAYGYDILFLAQGDSYSSADGTTWSGAYIATGPEGEYAKLAMGSCGGTNVATSFATPTYSIPSEHYYKPYGRDNFGGRVMVFTQADEDYASGILMDQWCKNNTKTQVMVLAGADIAATSAAAGTKLCVIAVGSPAVSAIQAQNPDLVAYTSYTAWYDNRTSSPGFIDASGATGYDSYTKGLTAVQSAVDQV